LVDGIDTHRMEHTAGLLGGGAWATAGDSKICSRNCRIALAFARLTMRLHPCTSIGTFFGLVSVVSEAAFSVRNETGCSDR
jgi:hypothetical protein